MTAGVVTARLSKEKSRADALEEARVNSIDSHNDTLRNVGGTPTASIVGLRRLVPMRRYAVLLGRTPRLRWRYSRFGTAFRAQHAARMFFTIPLGCRSSRAPPA